MRADSLLRHRTSVGVLREARHAVAVVHAVVSLGVEVGAVATVSCGTVGGGRVKSEATTKRTRAIFLNGTSGSESCVQNETRDHMSEPEVFDVRASMRSLPSGKLSVGQQRQRKRASEGVMTSR